MNNAFSQEADMLHIRIGVAVVTSVVLAACANSPRAETANGEVAPPVTAANARTFPYKANIVATNLQKQGGASTSETVKNAAIGAAAGAVLGAVLSGADKDKILLGGGLGAVAGTAISLGKNGENAVLPAGSHLS